MVSFSSDQIVHYEGNPTNQSPLNHSAHYEGDHTGLEVDQDYYGDEHEFSGKNIPEQIPMQSLNTQVKEG